MTRILLPQPPGPTWSPAWVAQWMRHALAAWALAMLAGCAVYWVSPYDAESVARTTQISRKVLSLYQQVLATPPAERAALAAGPLRAKSGEIETDIRLHLLLEQARPKNAESVVIIGNLLGSWSRFAANHVGDDPTALTDATLGLERGILERHLRSALVAEEAKKLGGGAGRGG